MKEKLLTKKEKEFLMFLMQYYLVDEIVFDTYDIVFYYKCRSDDASFGYPHKKLKFDKVQHNTVYTLKELGLEE